MSAVCSREAPHLYTLVTIFLPDLVWCFLLDSIEISRISTHYHSEQCCNTVKFHLSLVYLGKYTIKFLLTESSIHTGNSCSYLQCDMRMDLIAFGPYALNFRTNISSYEPCARLRLLFVQRSFPEIFLKLRETLIFDLLKPKLNN